MKIAIQTADLDHARIDGTRVYILNVLKHLGKLTPEDDFTLYHRNDYNPQLAPPQLQNYTEKKISAPFLWTQTAFAHALYTAQPDRLWMPMHSLPYFCPKKTKTIVTIHDLAFKLFPDHFPRHELRRINFLTDYAVAHADELIAVSQATKDDLLRFYPQLLETNVTVVHHGFDRANFETKVTEDVVQEFLGHYDLLPKKYILYTGAIQPRKNLITLIEAFERVRKEDRHMKLVLAGTKAWMWEVTYERIAQSPYKDDIIITGTVIFKNLAILYQNAAVFVFPSLYEGFGIPVLEAFASHVPVICANNSSLPEVAGDGALLFEARDTDDLTHKIIALLSDDVLRKELLIRGAQEKERFSWEKCAQETLAVIKK